MQIIKDTGTHLSGNTGTTVTYTNPITIANKPNRLLLVAMDGSGGASDVVTGVTWAGQAMTRLYSIRKPSNRWTSLWYLLAPTIGANNLVVSCSSSDYVEPSIVSYYNVKQQAPEAQGTNTGTSGAGGVGTATQIEDGQAGYNIAIVKRTDNPQGTPGAYRVNMSGDAQYASVTTITPGAWVFGTLGIGAGSWANGAISVLPIPDVGGNPVVFQGGGVSVG